MNVARVLVRTAGTTASRQLTTSANRAGVSKHLGYDKIRGTMSFYQVENGLPIHLKGGFMDNIMLMSTLGLNAIGLGMILQFIYVSSFPQKKD